MVHTVGRKKNYSLRKLGKICCPELVANCPTDHDSNRIVRRDLDLRLS